MSTPKEKNGALAASGDVFDLDTRGLSTLAIQVYGSMSATLQIEATIDGSHYVALNAVPQNSATPVTSITAAGVWIANVAGFLSVRLRCSAWVSGTPTIMLRAVEEGTPAAAGTGAAGAALAAGENHIGQVGGNLAVVTVTPTLTVHASYAANDFVGTSATAMVFDGAARVANGSGVIQSAELIDGALQSVAAELWLFDSAITPPNDSAAWTMSDADAKKLIGIIPFSTYYASALNSASPVNNIGLAFKAIGSDTKIYGCLVTRGAPAYADGDLTVRLTILQD